MMQRTLLAALAVAIGGAVAVSPAQAQDYPDYRFDIGINGGFSGYTAMLDDAHLTQDEDVRFEAGWLLGAQATGWFTPNIGLRGNFTYTERPVTEGGFFDMGEEGNLVGDVNLYQFSGDLMYRFGSPGAMGRPFLALGLGATRTNVVNDQVLTGGAADDDGAVNGVLFTTTDAQEWALAEETQLMGLVAIGTDLRLARNFLVRLELGDRIWDAPLRDAATLATDPEEDVGKVINQPYVQVGAHFLMGLEAPEVVAVAPAPPAPAPAPEPEPEPEPVEERIRVCVVDPSADNGLRMVDAIYLPETRDTVVVVSGMRRAFSTTVPRVMVANETDWFVRGEPLTVNIGSNATIEYTTWQSARMIEANRLTYLGTSRGLPVYASTDDVSGMRTPWNNARMAAGSNDLNAIIAEDAELAAQLEEVEYLYVPLRPTGCVFQTVRIVEQVRKK